MKVKEYLTARNHIVEAYLAVCPANYAHGITKVIQKIDEDGTIERDHALVIATLAGYILDGVYYGNWAGIPMKTLFKDLMDDRS